LLGLCICAALGFGGVAEAQQQASKLPRIGYLGASGDPRNPGRNFEAFRRGMKNLGYSDGESVLIEFRSAEGNLERAASLVSELLKLNVDVIVVGYLAGTRAAKQATRTVPMSW
jgi:putative ABC transport system substrate-binding protein